MIKQDTKVLEEKSIFILREAKQRFKNVAALWSMGKDSTTMLALARKAFLGNVPFPVIHIDNKIDFPETYAFREYLAKKWKLNLIVAYSEIKPDSIGSACCGQNKPDTLKKVMKQYGFDALIVSIRRDEHGIRSKERFFCFPKGRLVYGENIKPIEEINEGDYVYTHKGVLKPVRGVSSRLYEGEVLSLSLRYGTSIILTPNHVMLAKSNAHKKPSYFNTITSTGFDGKTRQVTLSLDMRKEISWYKASELKIGDSVFVPKIILPDVGINSIRIDEIIGVSRGMHIDKGWISWDSSHTNSPKTKLVIPLSGPVMRLFGYYVAEGSSNSAANQINLAFNVDETDIAKDVLQTIKSNFGAEGKIRKRTENGISVDINSKTLTLLFPVLFGSGAHHKKLPYFFDQLNESQLVELVKGCWIGDGCGERYSTVSRQLAEQLRLAMLKLGILTSLKRYSDERYVLNVAGLSKARFTEIFGLGVKIPYIGKYNVREITKLAPSSAEVLKSDTGGFWIPIEKIERINYNGMVYDLNVDEDSSYVVEGVAVHNSPRDERFKWNYKNQPAELWDEYSSKLDEGGHVRIHPLLDWNEVDVWSYIKKERIPINPLYFSRNGFRYRSLGCTNCTIPVKSNAKTVDEIVKELETTKIEERSGRSMDKENEYVMQRLRSLGYM